VRIVDGQTSGQTSGSIAS